MGGWGTSNRDGAVRYGSRGSRRGCLHHPQEGGGGAGEGGCLRLLPNRRTAAVTHVSCPVFLTPYTPYTRPRRHGARTPLSDRSELWEGVAWDVCGEAYKVGGGQWGVGRGWGGGEGGAGEVGRRWGGEGGQWGGGGEGNGGRAVGMWWGGQGRTGQA